MAEWASTLIVFFVCTVLLLVIGLITVGSLVAKASLELYALLSHEFLTIEEVLRRTTNSKSVALRFCLQFQLFRYFGKKLFDLECDNREEYALLYLLDFLTSTSKAEVKMVIATHAWLNENEFLLRDFPKEELDRLREAADAEFAESKDLVHTESDEPCAKCESESELEVIILARKLPMGYRPPRPDTSAERGVHGIPQT